MQGIGQVIDMTVASAPKGECVMTDYQFKTILKMVRDIVNRSDDVEEIRRSLNELIGEEPAGKEEGDE
jgi:hypothetical protein